MGLQIKRTNSFALLNFAGDLKFAVAVPEQTRLARLLAPQRRGSDEQAQALTRQRTLPVIVECARDRGERHGSHLNDESAEQYKTDYQSGISASPPLQSLDNGLHFQRVSFNTTEVRSKSLTALVLCHIARAETPPPPQFLGSQTCSTSGCHGSAKVNRDQSLVWSKKDFH